MALLSPIAPGQVLQGQGVKSENDVIDTRSHPDGPFRWKNSCTALAAVAKTMLICNANKQRIR